MGPPVARRRSCAVGQPLLHALPLGSRRVAAARALSHGGQGRSGRRRISGRVRTQRARKSGSAIARDGWLTGALAAALVGSAACLAQTTPTADPRVVIDRLDANFRQFNAIGVVYQ